MEKLFGKAPTQQATSGIGSQISQQEGIDSELQKRFHRIIDHIRAGVDHHEFGKILSQTENSVMHTKISKIEFDGSDSCIITFNDRPQDDDFEVEGDMNHNLESANDIYEVKIESDASIVVEKGHPNNIGVMHFAPVGHDDIVKMVAFVERCMNLQ